MLGITSSREEAEYSLDLNEKAQPIKQWLLHFTQDRKESIRVEVTQLLAAGFIREVTHPDWLVNPVLVKKKNDEWRMYVDYTDLNKHCPKHPFPLPHIDQVIAQRLDAFSSLSLTATQVTIISP